MTTIIARRVPSEERRAALREQSGSVTVGESRSSNPFSQESMMSKVLSHNKLMNPLLKALKDLGGSGSIDEMHEEVSKNMGLSDEVLAILHNPEKSNQTELKYRLAWARTYLKHFGVLEKSSRGVWAI